MSTIKERLQNDFDRMVRNPMFGEPISYLESATGILYEDEYVVVYRNENETFNNRAAGGVNSSQPVYDIQIRVCNKRIQYFIVKNDVAILPLVIGGETRRFKVMSILGQDLATVKLGLKA